MVDGMAMDGLPLAFGPEDGMMVIPPGVGQVFATDRVRVPRRYLNCGASPVLWQVGSVQSRGSQAGNGLF
ncbi:MAG: hypothetical protein RIS70_2413 [Planctomycetota bacterium]|jgi:hypothetical protein